MIVSRQKMRRAAVVLTPAESKRLIAKAVVKLDLVRNALRNGIVVVSVGTTCLCILEELMQKRLRIDDHLSGVILPGRLCISRGKKRHVQTQKHAGVWIFEKGHLVPGLSLGNILPQMTNTDVFIKGANALDPSRKAGVLLAGGTGGTIGKVLPTIYARGINLIIPVGLEKTIPTTGVCTK